jgi:inorganic pyrophosphatase
MDYDNKFSTGDVDNGYINAVIEIPVDTIDKIEWRRDTHEMEIDRTEPTTFPEPTNYGFIPRTLAEDGDALDVLVMSSGPINTGMVVKAKILGVMRFVDNDEIDDKIIASSVDSRYEQLSDISGYTLDKITYYFSHYKDDIDGKTKVLGWSGVKEARKTIFKSIKLWKKSKYSR